MEERILICLLLDLYGELLTEKQRLIMNMYHNEDLSLAEISEITSTSRQAIHDILKRCQRMLQEYEEKLHLVEKNLEINKAKNRIMNDLNLLRCANNDKKVLEIINRIEHEFSNIL